MLSFCGYSFYFIFQLICFLFEGNAMPHLPLPLLVLSPYQTSVFYEGVQYPEEKVTHPWGEEQIQYETRVEFLSLILSSPHELSEEDLVYVLFYLGSSSLSISMYFLFWAFPGAASSSFLIWAMRIFWKSS